LLTAHQRFLSNVTWRNLRTPDSVPPFFATPPRTEYPLAYDSIWFSITWSRGPTRRGGFTSRVMERRGVRSFTSRIFLEHSWLLSKRLVKSFITRHLTSAGTKKTIKFAIWRKSSRKP